MRKINEMLKKHRRGLALSSLVILLPPLAGLLLWRFPPEGVGKALTANGLVSICCLSGGLLLGHWLCLWLTFADAKNREQTKKGLGLAFWICPFLSLAANGISLAVSLGISAVRLFPASLGLLFALLGNYLPKVKPNSTIGFKLSWTLRSEENWVRTHRFGGRVWVLVGVLMMLSVFLPKKAVQPVLIAGPLLLFLPPLLYSYLYEKKHSSGEKKAAGTVSEAERKKNKNDKTACFAAAVIASAVLGFVAVQLTTGDIRPEYGENALTLRASYFADLTLPYGEIESIEYRGHVDAGMRTNGFGSPRLQMGSYENDEFGSYVRYNYTKCPACLVVRTKDETYVLSGKDEEDTRALEAELRRRLPVGLKSSETG